MRKIVSMIMLLVMGVSVLTAATVVAPVSAANGFNSGVCNDPAFSDVSDPDVKAMRDAAGCDEDGGDLPERIRLIIGSVTGILGVIAVVVLIISGFQYATAAGDPGKIAKAKKAIQYSIIGLIVVVMAYAITAFVVSVA